MVCQAAVNKAHTSTLSMKHCGCSTEANPINFNERQAVKPLVLTWTAGPGFDSMPTKQRAKEGAAKLFMITVGILLAQRIFEEWRRHTRTMPRRWWCYADYNRQSPVSKKLMASHNIRMEWMVECSNTTLSLCRQAVSCAADRAEG